MDFNLVVVAGRLATAPDFDATSRSRSEPGGQLPLESRPRGRLLLTVRSRNPNRVDLLPVAACVGQIPSDVRAGDRVAVAGRLQRRVSARTGRSRLEIVADHIERKPPRERQQ